MASASDFFLRPDFEEVEGQRHTRVAEVALGAFQLLLDEDRGEASPVCLRVLGPLGLLDEVHFDLLFEQGLAGAICGLNITEANLHKP